MNIKYKARPKIRRSLHRLDLSDGNEEAILGSMNQECSLNIYVLIHDQNVRTNILIYAM